MELSLACAEVIRVGAYEDAPLAEAALTQNLAKTQEMLDDLAVFDLPALVCRGELTAEAGEGS
jgi:hypothetical protein